MRIVISVHTPRRSLQRISQIGTAMQKATAMHVSQSRSSQRGTAMPEKDTRSWL